MFLIAPPPRDSCWEPTLLQISFCVCPLILLFPEAFLDPEALLYRKDTHSVGGS